MVGISIVGVSGVIKSLKVKDKLIKVALANAIKEAGFFIEGEVVESIAGHRAETKSVDTGRFKNSISSDSIGLYEVVVSSSVEYAKHLEYGTSKVLPRPHFRNTAKRNEKRIRDFIEKKIR
ncbi:MAG: HK97 gp10 family phage protein [Candidatus Heimdallarchaeaceae archaeon]